MSIPDKIIIGHYRKPRQKGKAHEATCTHEVMNRACGDHLSFSARIKERKIEELFFEGKGCMFCIASASIACSILNGRYLDEALKEAQNMRDWLEGRESVPPQQPEMEALGEIKSYPMRVACAELAWKGVSELFMLSGKNDIHSD